MFCRVDGDLPGNLQKDQGDKHACLPTQIRVGYEEGFLFSWTEFPECVLSIETLGCAVRIQKKIDIMVLSLEQPSLLGEIRWKNVSNKGQVKPVQDQGPRYVVQMVRDPSEESGVVQRGCMAVDPEPNLGGWEGLRKMQKSLRSLGQEFQNEGPDLAQN